MSRYGGAGILPSGAYHLEAPTTVTDRPVEAWEIVLAEQSTDQPLDRSADRSAELPVEATETQPASLEPQAASLETQAALEPM